jgi:hypothetical protein
MKKGEGRLYVSMYGYGGYEDGCLWECGLGGK